MIEIVGMFLALFAAVLALCAVTVNWPWIPVVAVIVRHVSDLRRAI